MATYLSGEWIDELDAAASGDAQLRDATARIELTVQQIVTGGPAGDVAYHVVADHGTVRVAEGHIDGATVTFTQSYDTAVAVATGELSAQGAFMTGRIRVSGDVGRLVDDLAAFTSIDDVFARVRERTAY